MLHVRTASAEDMPVIYRFICELEETTFPFAVFEKYYLENIISDNIIYLVSVDDHKIVRGFLGCHRQLLLHHCGWVFEIQEMFVEKEFRKMGVGMSLMIALDERLSKLPYRSLEVTANINRLDTHAYYRAACGFQETHKKFTKEKNR